MALDAFLFDLDGTLVDSNPLHVEAFVRAFAENGYTVASDRIAIEIGKGSDHLIPDVLGKSANERDGEKIREGWKTHFLRIIKERGIPVLPGAVELVEAAKTRGLRVALATSGAREVLEAMESASGVAWRSLFEVVTTSSDAESSKPAPDVISAAIQKLGVSPASCAFVGDTPYDARACRAAGLACVGLSDQEHARADLREAGARLVYDSTQQLLNHFDTACQKLSPGARVLTQADLEGLMRAALEMANEALAKGDMPIGSIVANGNGQILARGYNQVQTLHSKVAHAEMQALEAAAGKSPHDASDLILVSTVEPCVMCAGAAM